MILMFIPKGLIYNSENYRQGKYYVYIKVKFPSLEFVIFSFIWCLWAKNPLHTHQFQQYAIKTPPVVVASLIARVPKQLCIILPPTAKFSIFRHTFELPRALLNFIYLDWNLSCWVFAQGHIILKSVNENCMGISKEDIKK